MNLALNFKADAALAVQLIARHRTPQLAAIVVTAGIIVSARWTLPVASGGISPETTLLTAAAVQGGLVGSRLATPAALATARAAGAAASVIVLGRLAGAFVLLLPVLFVQVAAVLPLSLIGSTLPISMTYALSVAALAMAAARWFGSTTAAFLVPGFVVVSTVSPLTQAIHGAADSRLVALLVSGMGFIAVTAGAVLLLRERPLRLGQPTSTTQARRWGRHARR